MKVEPMHHRRQSARLKRHDYTGSSAYLVTICTYQRQLLFGDIDDNGEMVLNTVGCVVQAEWERTPMIRPDVILDEFVVMPNHIHGIIILNGASEGVCRRQTPTPQFGRPISGSLGSILGQFKSIVTKRCRKLLMTDESPIWQKNYHDQIIYHEKALNNIRKYVVNNPLRWAIDRYNKGYEINE